jgi:hypothetical protein
MHAPFLLASPSTATQFSEFLCLALNSHYGPSHRQRTVSSCERCRDNAGQNAIRVRSESLSRARSISELNNIIIFDNQRKLKEGERGEREKHRKMGAEPDWRMQK